MATHSTAKKVTKVNPNSDEARRRRRASCQIAPVLNAEIRRIAHAENKTDEKSMHQLMQEIAVICGLDNTRMVYHWRSGKHPLPAEHLPALCERFKSFALLEIVKSVDIEIEIPNNFDLALEANRALREDLAFHERLLLTFEDGQITPGELLELRELEARAHRNLHLMCGIAEASCLAGVSRKGSVAAKRSEVRDQRSEVGKRVAR
jgi:hypothetical protein